MGLVNSFLLPGSSAARDGSAAIVGADQSEVDLLKAAGRASVCFGYVPVDCHHFIPGDFNETYYRCRSWFPFVLASHVMEHQHNVGVFLGAVRHILTDDGLFMVSVPPLKHAIVGGHVSLWNMGLLIYNLTLHGFDTRNGSFLSSGYNLIACVRKSTRPLPPLNHDRGDLEILADWWPASCPLRQNTDGRILSVNWPPHKYQETP
jgi:hypothetical protein